MEVLLVANSSLQMDLVVTVWRQIEPQIRSLRDSFARMPASVNLMAARATYTTKLAEMGPGLGP